MLVWQIRARKLSRLKNVHNTASYHSLILYCSLFSLSHLGFIRWLGWRWRTGEKKRRDATGPARAYMLAGEASLWNSDHIIGMTATLPSGRPVSDTPPTPHPLYQSPTHSSYYHTVTQHNRLSLRTLDLTCLEVLAYLLFGILKDSQNLTLGLWWWMVEWLVRPTTGERS